MTEPRTTIPKGSWIRVTAWLQSSSYGSRSSKSSWLVEDLFKSSAYNGDFELVQVSDLAATGAFDESVKGMSAVLHVASITSFDPDPNKVVPQTVAGATSILHASLQQPSMKAFVYTSSIVAASKTEAEIAVQKFIAEKKPHFGVNSVFPAAIIGEPLDKKHLEIPYAFLKILYDGNISVLPSMSPVFHIDVKDVALLHVAAVLDPGLKNARLQAWAESYGWYDVLAIHCSEALPRTKIWRRYIVSNTAFHDN
ncbi:hypothetical protein BP6252_13049 [Coleophoma cylindrospora]|uniref:3-beta hydroxysteroid dehydrogenase/isomerase domain-containing protein n=1 Tax=Coleophoma cylindrospora TaxID=1849047 RepID=A0A3D8QDN5_9HELO|nr:hypothetical protein BP6252_13049 [Coleophoma cylindrospora]